MLEFDTALDLMKKYGYSSTSVHPYIYQNGDTIGICYYYNDEEYGGLERIKLFNDSEDLEKFLKEQSFVKNNGKYHHIRMSLDNYASINPKILYLRNEKVMNEGEMFDIENVDLRESQRRQMDDASKLLYEAGDLFLVYDQLKERQLNFFKKLITLKNTLREKYFELQKEIDEYNKVKIERNLTLLPDVIDKGNINEAVEITLKDRYNMYISNIPSIEEIKDFLKEVWDLNLALESNYKYYEAQKEENETHNEIKIVDQKIDLMRKLNENLKPLFGVDLVGKFKRINEECKKESNYLSENYVSEQIEIINKKYAVYDRIDPLYTSDYLREAIQNTNYEDLAIKYSIGITEEILNKPKLPLNEVAADITIQYKNKLTEAEQSILALYNNHKYRDLFNVILEIDNFEAVPIKDIIKQLNTLKNFSKLKTECYESVKRRINEPVNEAVKNTLFNDVDFTSFETFISSLIKKITILKNVNNKMVINSDIIMYCIINNTLDIKNRKFISVTKDLNSLLTEAKETKSSIGIVTIKENTPVLYSPGYFDIGDLYSKGASPLMEIKEMTNFELLVELNDVLVNINDVKVKVARYQTEPKLNGNISYVDDIKLSYNTEFCKFSFANNLPQTSTENAPVIEKPVTMVAPIVSEATMEPIQPNPPVLVEPVGEPVQPTTETTIVNIEPNATIENQPETSNMVSPVELTITKEPVVEARREEQEEVPKEQAAKPIDEINKELKPVTENVTITPVVSVPVETNMVSPTELSKKEQPVVDVTSIKAEPEKKEQIPEPKQLQESVEKPQTVEKSIITPTELNKEKQSEIKVTTVEEKTKEEKEMVEHQTVTKVIVQPSTEQKPNPEATKTIIKKETVATEKPKITSTNTTSPIELNKTKEVKPEVKVEPKIENKQPEKVVKKVVTNTTKPNQQIITSKDLKAPQTTSPQKKTIVVKSLNPSKENDKK